MIKDRYIRLAFVSLAGFFVLLLYGLLDPSTIPFPKCPVKYLTGLSCPGCGSQRALHSLIQFRIAEAIHYNAFFVLFIPFLVLALINWITSGRFNTSGVVARKGTGIIIALLFFGWTLFRNIVGI